MRETRPVPPRQADEWGQVSASRLSGYARLRAPRWRKPILEWLGDRTLLSVTLLAVADLDTDGRLDSVYADASLDRVVVDYGTDAGTVQAAPSGSLLPPGAVEPADLNGDGIPDLAVADGGGDGVLVYLGLGDGQFGPALNGGLGFFTGTDPVGVTAADVNGDGRPDLVVANRGSDDVSVLLNVPKGDGLTFILGQRLRAGAEPAATVVRDVTGDGKPDILVSNSLSGSVALLPGVGGGFFNDQDPQTFQVGGNPGPIFVGNFDGKPDLVTVNAGSSSNTLIFGFAGSEPATTTVTQFPALGTSALGLIPTQFTARASSGGSESMATSPAGTSLVASFLPGAGAVAVPGRNNGGPGDGTTREARSPEESADPGPGEGDQIQPSWARLSMGLERAWKQIPSVLLDEGETPDTQDRPNSDRGEESRPHPRADRSPNETGSGTGATLALPVVPAAEESDPRKSTFPVSVDLALDDLAAEADAGAWASGPWDGPDTFGQDHFSRSIVTMAAAASVVAVAWSVGIQRSRRRAEGRTSKRLLSAI